MKGKWTVLSFLCGLFLVYTVDRALLGIVAKPMMAELNLTKLQLGVLSSGIFWTYALVVPFAGMAGDRFDRQGLIGFAVITWSVMTVLAGFAGGFWSIFLLVSFAIVVPQTLYGPAANALIASCHQETRTIAMSCHQAAYYTGWFVSGVFVAAVLSIFGTWRAAFFVTGGVGLVLGVVYLLTGRHANAAQTAIAREPTFKEGLKAFWGCPSALLLGSGYVAEVFVGYGYSAWGPTFISEKFNLSAAQAGSGVMFWHYAFSFVAILVTGWLTDCLLNRCPRIRLVLGIGSTFLAIPALVCFGLCPVLGGVWVAAAVFGVMRGIFGANQFAAVFDVIAPEFRAGAIGFLNVLAGLIGSLAPIALGGLAQTYGTRGFEIGFVAMGALYLLAVGLLAVAFCKTYLRDRLRTEIVK